MRPQQKLLFFTLVSKKKERSKTDDVLINQELFSFEMRNHASFTEMNMILMTVTKAQLLSFDS